MVKIDKHGKLKVESPTPRVGGNRQQRRFDVFGNVGARVAGYVKDMQVELRKAGIKFPPTPKHKQPKYLSGYLGRLVEIARKEVADHA